MACGCRPRAISIRSIVPNRFITRGKTDPFIAGKAAPDRAHVHPLDDLWHFQHRIDFGLNAAKQAGPLQMVGVAAQIGEVSGTGGHGGEG